jgi:transposase
LEKEPKWFAGIDWGSQKHRLCLLNVEGKILDQRWVEHNGSSLVEMAELLRKHAAEPSQLAVAIEVPRGAIVETLVEQGFAVFSINPKQLDRFRDRYSPAGAKDDERDALVLADALRTDRHCFRAVQLDDPEIIRLRELSRLEDGLMQERNRAANQLWEQLQRYFPQLLQLCSSANEPWLWDLLEKAPSPAQAAELSARKIEQLLRRHRIRRLDASQVKAVLHAPPLCLAPGAAEAASEHALLLLPRLRLLHNQQAQVAVRIEGVLAKLAEPLDAAGETHQHRDAAILLSLPGVGRKIAATMLSEASQAIAQRDYHALRCYAGAAPITRQSGKKKSVGMRYGCNPRLRLALYHWTRVSSQKDPKTKQRYAEMRARGHSHGRALRGLADRWLATLVSMLRHNTLYVCHPPPA